MAVCYLAAAYNKIDHRNETLDEETVALILLYRKV